MLPMYLATGEMIRHIGAGAAVIGHAHIPWENFNLHQLSLSQAIGIVIRPTWIDIVGSPYVGPLGVIGTLANSNLPSGGLILSLRMLVLAFGISLPVWVAFRFRNEPGICVRQLSSSSY